jgi:hypothetical protein
MSGTGRRRLAIGLAIGLAIAAPLVVAIAVAADANRGYVYGRAVDRPFFAAGFAALMLAAAARLALARQALRYATYLAAGLVALLAFWSGIAVLTALPTSGPTERGVIATSAGFKVVAYQEEVLFRSDVLVLRVQTRAGLLSREGGAIACFMAPGVAVSSSWLFGQARFSAPNQLAVSAADGTTWSLTFDQGSLNVANELDRCSGAPDPRAD